MCSLNWEAEDRAGCPISGSSVLQLPCAESGWSLALWPGEKSRKEHRKIILVPSRTAGRWSTPTGVSGICPTTEKCPEWRQPEFSRGRLISEQMLRSWILQSCIAFWVLSPVGFCRMTKSDSTILSAVISFTLKPQPQDTLIRNSSLFPRWGFLMTSAGCLKVLDLILPSVCSVSWATPVVCRMLWTP